MGGDDDGTCVILPKYAYFRWFGSGLCSSSGGSLMDGFVLCLPLVCRSKDSNFRVQVMALTSLISYLGSSSLKNSSLLNNSKK